MMRGLLRAAVVVALVSGVLFVAGCNTMEGFGQDMENAGSAIERKAQQKGAD